MDKEILYKLILLGKLHKHQTEYLKDNSAELMNPINKILVEIISDDKIRIRYNYNDDNLIIVLTTETVYDFFEDLLTREVERKLDVKLRSLILIDNWKIELKEYINIIQQEKDYNPYLKHLKYYSSRFEVEYYDDIIVLRDKEGELMTNVLRLKDAIQQILL